MFLYNTGQQPRSLRSGYCAVRALVIATGMPWKDAEQHVRTFVRNGKAGHGMLSKGVMKDDYDAALKALGFVWKAAPKFVDRKAKCRDIQGVVIARQAGHYVAVIDGVVNDIWDCSERMVYGYWKTPTIP